ncbi:MAG: hypothetical protein ACKVP3_07955 [Hyphomicrobiaceae bacterium]
MDAVGAGRLKIASADLSDRLAEFTGPDLTHTLSRLETAVLGVTDQECRSFLQSAGAGREVLAAAAEMKRLAAQINVTIHALGILMCLPHILKKGERVESISLGAGNTGRQFDLETNFRVAEFKFIHWRGRSETIRQNAVFKDHVSLAMHATEKDKYLYLLGVDHALKFLGGGRALSSVLSRNMKLRGQFLECFGDRFHRVRDYYAAHKHAVRIEDVSPWLSELAGKVIAEPLESDAT